MLIGPAGRDLRDGVGHPGVVDGGHIVQARRPDHDVVEGGGVQSATGDVGYRVGGTLVDPAQIRVVDLQLDEVIEHAVNGAGQARPFQRTDHEVHPDRSAGVHQGCYPVHVVGMGFAELTPPVDDQDDIAEAVIGGLAGGDQIPVGGHRPDAQFPEQFGAPAHHLVDLGHDPVDGVGVAAEGHPADMRQPFQGKQFGVRAVVDAEDLHFARIVEQGGRQAQRLQGHRFSCTGASQHHQVAVGEIGGEHALLVVVRQVDEADGKVQHRLVTHTQSRSGDKLADGVGPGQARQPHLVGGIALPGELVENDLHKLGGVFQFLAGVKDWVLHRGVIDHR